jgi:hypothetical protein
MEYLGQLSHKATQNLLQIYGRDYLRDLVQISTLAQHAIYNQMGRQRG